MATDDPKTLVSTDKDPVGEVGLWGFTAKVMVPNSCQQAFTALRDIESYPKRMEKVKRRDNEQHSPFVWKA